MEKNNKTVLSLIIILLVGIILFVGVGMLVKKPAKVVVNEVNPFEETDKKSDVKMVFSEKSDTNIEPVIELTKDTLKVEKQIHPGLPKMFFTLRDLRDSSDTKYAIEISNANGSIQTIENVEATNGLIEKKVSPIMFGDFNFDGYLDIKFSRYGESSKIGYYWIFIYNPAESKFVRYEALSEVRNPIPHAEGKLVYSYEDFGVERYIKKWFRLEDKNLILVKKITRTLFYTPESEIKYIFPNSDRAIEVTSEMVNGSLVKVNGEIIDLNTETRSPVDIELLKDRYYVAKLDTSTPQYDESSTVMGLIGWKTEDAQMSLWHRAFELFASDKREGGKGNSKTFFFKLLAGVDDMPVGMKFENEKSSVVFSEAPEKIIKMMEDPFYCEQDSDCVSGAGWECPVYPSKNFVEHIFVGNHGCYNPQYVDEDPQYIKSLCSSGKSPEIRYSDFVCVSNKCAANSKEFVMCRDVI